MTQLIRMTVAYTCLVLVMVFVALWAASYFFLILASYRLNADERLGINSERGQLNWSWHQWTPGEVTYPIYWRAIPLEQTDRMMHRSRRIWPPEPSLIGFGTFRSDRQDLYVVTPHWFPIVLIGAVGIIAKPRPKLKLSIRDLLIITTILAIVLTIAASTQRGLWTQELKVPPGARLRTVKWEANAHEISRAMKNIAGATIAARRYPRPPLALLAVSSSRRFCGRFCAFRRG
jgi:hypothetical protein